MIKESDNTLYPTPVSALNGLDFASSEPSSYEPLTPGPEAQAPSESVSSFWSALLLWKSNLGMLLGSGGSILHRGR